MTQSEIISQKIQQFFNIHLSVREINNNMIIYQNHCHQNDLGIIDIDHQNKSYDHVLFDAHQYLYATSNNQISYIRQILIDWMHLIHQIPLSLTITIVSDINDNSTTQLRMFGYYFNQIIKHHRFVSNEPVNDDINIIRLSKLLLYPFITKFDKSLIYKLKNVYFYFCDTNGEFYIFDENQLIIPHEIDLSDDEYSSIHSLKNYTNYAMLYGYDFPNDSSDEK